MQGKYEDTNGLRYFGNEKIRMSNLFEKKKLEPNVKRMSQKIRRAGERQGGRELRERGRKREGRVCAVWHPQHTPLSHAPLTRERDVTRGVRPSLAYSGSSSKAASGERLWMMPDFAAHMSA